MHELTKQIMPHQQKTCKEIDQIIRQWLEEKAEEIGNNYAPLETHKKVDEILGLTEKTLEEKFKDHYLDKNKTSLCIIEELAQIAEEHYKEPK